jgi:hypothetical protein
MPADDLRDFLTSLRLRRSWCYLNRDRSNDLLVRNLVNLGHVQLVGFDEGILVIIHARSNRFYYGRRHRDAELERG